MEATVFISHGSRSEQGNKVFVSFIEKVISTGKNTNASYGFLENARPTIFEAVEACILKGASSVTVVPVLLLPGIHANVDIPEELERVGQKYPEIEMFYGQPLGVNESILEIVLDRLKEKGFSGKNSETILLVGHGSRDPLAAEEFEKLAVRVREDVPSKVDTAYITTQPLYGEKLQASDSSSKIYILPFLLYTGGFTAKMKETVEGIMIQSPAKEIVLCEPVGFDDRLGELLMQRVDEARTR
ncbi:sirohydrochlorin chelatase [Mesobacillus selenatarsenatis]|uniref:Sirohydrochlorin cobaltochelatase n=1 Tax=Mesobacillus selenatarsenatis (strain DSM 18680 / JCM 14380 / FERM P-15431 / SF-1) TaxID=1321606 RepID=A0A0A8X7P1_MESS1|nr:sirohydrochlorin chelatase [Mesobacillus selenatarsenatis]GAM14186.1 sirohydrochlorin cobaltochelatase [Mesobacillus selenatarsenatis SF-1]